MSLSEVAGYLKVAEKTLLRMVHRGEIPCVKIASQWRFVRERIDEWILSKMDKAHQNEIARLIESDREFMPFSRLTGPEYVLPNLQPGSKRDVLRQLIAPLVERGSIGNEEVFLHKLEDREAMLSTALENGIALPHIRDPGENPQGDPHIVIGICRPGTDFEAQDGGLTKLFFLILAKSIASHLRILSKTAQLLGVAGSVERFLEVTTGQQVIRLLLEHEYSLKTTGLSFHSN